MKFALFDVNIGACTTPEAIASIARQAEESGFDSLWCGEHVVLPDPRVPPSPMEPTDAILDPVIALTFVAAVTTRVGLGTGVIILPQRNPLVLAKELASLDVLSNGRLIFGLGVGYLEPEFTALGVPLKDHGPRGDEYVAAMRAIWSMAAPEYRGRFVSFGGVNAYPRPVQKPVPQIVVGGHSPAAFRRSVEQAHGWYGFGRDLERTATCLDGLHEAAARYSRPPELGTLEISVTPPPGPIDRDLATRYADLGVDRLILRQPRSGGLDGVRSFVDQVATDLIARGI